MLIVLSLSGTFKVKDAVKGYGVSANVSVDGSTYTARGGILTLDLEAGRHTVRVEAKGYRPLKSRLLLRRGGPLTYEFLLQPEVKPTPPKGERGKSVWYGWVVDAATLRPVVGVEVVVESGRGTYKGRTDSTGMYVLRIPVEKRGEEPERVKVSFRKEGYGPLVKEGILLLEGVYRLNVEITPGDRGEVERDIHGLFEGGNSKKKAPEGEGTRDGGEGLFAALLVPPPSIKVGRACSCRTCSTVSVVSLETYVQYGLDDEWIASWPDHSLRAGAVPYRSYGAWHVFNPIDSSYDICDNTCCQVWDPSDSYTSTEDAAIYTSGIMLESGGNVARSEYSAETNDCGCGDGYSGDGTYWPCIRDVVCSGHTCYGHGRGMCQWGSSRWAALDSTWKWINEHYYLPGGFHLSSPITVRSIWPHPRNVCIGDTVVIDVVTVSYTEYPLNRIMIGASLYNGTYLDDPPRDRNVSVPPGTTATYRLFVIPSTADTGLYDLVVTLWFDVDENGAINSRDFPMATKWMYSAVSVCSPMDVRDEEIGVVAGGMYIEGPFSIYDPLGRRVLSGKGGWVRLKRGIYFVLSRKGVRKVLAR